MDGERERKRSWKLNSAPSTRLTTLLKIPFVACMHRISPEARAHAGSGFSQTPVGIASQRARRQLAKRQRAAAKATSERAGRVNGRSIEGKCPRAGTNSFFFCLYESAPRMRPSVAGAISLKRPRICEKKKRGGGGITGRKCTRKQGGIFYGGEKSNATTKKGRTIKARVHKVRREGRSKAYCDYDGGGKPSWRLFAK